MKIIVIFLIASLVIAEPGFEFSDQTEYFGKLLGEDLSFHTETGYVKFPEIGSIFYHLVLREGVPNLDAIDEDDVLAIWLNGGPGSSSQLGNYMEIGPWSIQKNPDQEDKDKPFLFSKREYAWNKKMHLIFIDQPFGAGMSIEIKKGEVINSDQAANYFIQTIRTIYNSRSELKRCQTYIFGESYGGHYVPAFASKLVQTADVLKLTKFQGIAIVDGITDTLNQLNNYHSYLYNIGVISQVDLQKLQKEQAIGQQAILNGDYVKGTQQLDLMTDDKFIESIGLLNVYNVRRYKNQDDYDYSWVDFLNTNIKHFTDDKDKFEKSNEEIYEAFTEDISQSRLEDIVLLLNKKYKVLLLNGQLDYIIHTPGALNWIYNMKWIYSNQWKNQQKEFIQFLLPGETNKYETHGYIKKYENFQYATIYKAGHMIPTDNPKAAMKVIEDFIQ